MKVLVLNCGSSSVRFQLVENIGGAAILRYEADIAPEGRACRGLVIPTNEELLIARDTFRIVRGLPLA